MSQVEKSLSIANPHPPHLNTQQKLSLGLTFVGILMIILPWLAGNFSTTDYRFLLLPALSLIGIGTLWYSYVSYKDIPEGIKNNGNYFNSLTNKGTLAWISGIVITGFYVCLYWFPQTLGLGVGGAANSGLVQMFDPLSYALNGKAASQWFVYGALYTLIILVLGVKFMIKYRHNRYQQIRTLSVMFFQTAFAFLIPEFLAKMNGDLAYFSKDMKNMWPLNYYFFEDWHLNNMLNGGNLGLFMLILGIAMILVISPLLTYFYGKRWYCSWVCGCGGLAETAGDPFRHLSDKSKEAWHIERILIYGILVFILFTTALVLTTYFTGNSFSFQMNPYLIICSLIVIAGILLFAEKKLYPEMPNKKSIITALVIVGTVSFFIIWKFIYTGQTFQFDTYKLRSWYAFFVGAAFSGVIGVGFYPLLGSRVWCRFGCPMAAILGLQQRFFSRFRITTNGAQCISCGNCSTYCEMGIDVRWYAQRGQDIVRSSCVGCGVCSAVCPRGVLKLENGPVESRKIIDISEDSGIRVNV